MIRQSEDIVDIFTLIIDLFLMGIGFYSVINLYTAKQVLTSTIPFEYFLLFFLYLIFWLLSTNIIRVYRHRRFTSLLQEGINLLKSHFISFSMTLIFLNLYNPKLINNRFLFYYLAVCTTLTISAHILECTFLQQWRSKGRNKRYGLLIGNGPAAELVLEKIRKTPQLGLSVIGYLAPDENGLDIPYLGDYSKLESILTRSVIDTTIITESVYKKEIKDCFSLLEAMGKNVAVMLDQTVSDVVRSRPVDFGGLSMVAFDGYPRKPWQELTKRCLDLLISTLALVALSPLMILTSIIIKMTSRGPVFFAQERVGLSGRRFKMFKFRSMVVNAEDLKEQLTDQNEMDGPVFKITNDPRITPIGQFLRKSSIDELPQLLNVFKGDMSIVGPRPQLPNEVDMYNPNHRKRLNVKPGLTCIWQISGRSNVGFDKWMEMDAQYVDQWSLKMDLIILLKTIPVVLTGKGAK